MKLYQLIIILSLFTLLLGECASETASSKDECNKKELSEGEKFVGYKYCCYFTAKAGGITGSACLPISQESYDKIDDYIKSLETISGASDIKVDCNSHYLELGLIGLLFLLI